LLTLSLDKNFIIEPEYEDIHSKIESYLVLKCGDAGKKIHTARSRNDQVLVAIQLYFKDYISTTKNKVLDFCDILLNKAGLHKDDIFPGYTHFQAAMPSSFGLWFSAYAEHLLLDLYLFESAYNIADQNPLGSAAGFGTSFPIDREFTTKSLNFKHLLISSAGAQILRGKTEKTLAFALSGMASTLSKMAYDLVIYNCQDFNFVSLPKEYTTGSSIMPHKKNPDVFELTRAHCNKIQTVPNEIMMVMNNLPSGYHRDFQILKEILFEPMQMFHKILDMMMFAVDKIKIKQNITDQTKYDTIYTVENINQLVQQGIPFREAYKKVGSMIEDNTYIPNKIYTTSHTGSIHNLGIDSIKTKILQFKNETIIH
jgi:argininosuccinate lyase